MKNIILFQLLVFSSLLSGQVSNGIVANYSFNYGNANDNNGTAANGTVTSASPTNDRFGNSNAAYSFSGNSYIDCGNAAAVGTLTSAYSISAWFRRASFSGQLEVIAAKWDFTPASEHMFLATQNNQLVWATPGPGNSGTSDTSKIKANTWTHAVITWSAGGAVCVYMNGVLSSSVQMSAYTVNITSPVSFMIGAQSPTTRLFNGQIDDVKIYSRVLNTSEVSQLYNEANPLSPVGLSTNERSLSGTEVFPNPSDGKMTLRSKQPEKLKLLSIDGRLLREIELGEINQLECEINGLEMGMYLITSGDFKKKKKIVVTR